MANKNNNIPMPLTLQTKQQNLFMEGALSLHKMGFTVIPLLPDKKRPPCKWDEWENNHSEQKIIDHWTAHPEHEVGILTNPELIVFDADTQESLDVLYSLETAFEVEPLLKVKTRKGEHHYFKRPSVVIARQGGFSSDKNPECIDVKTDRSLVVAPPSKNKKFIQCDIKQIAQLSSVTQELIDAICKHNGREPAKAPPSVKPSMLGGKHIRNYFDSEVDAFLEHVPADIDYDDWTRVGMALHHEYQGSEAGLERYDVWSKQADNYAGLTTIRNKWKSFSGYDGKPVTIESLKQLAAEHGADIRQIFIDNSFSKTEMAVSSAQTSVTAASSAKVPVEPTISAPEAHPRLNPLEKFAINDQLDALKKEAREAVYVMDNIALKSQLTNFYAKPNTGKTLITLKLIVEQIKAGVIDGKSVYFINADDSFNGLTEKLELLIPYGMKVLAPGHNHFKADDSQAILNEITSTGLASSSIIIFDTLKKFADIMSKPLSSGFWRVLRSFSASGGTLISLAHTNKNNGPDGKPIFGGTSDSLEDADCAYTLARIDDGEDYAIVEFSNIKNRGNVRQKAYFRFSLKEGQSYAELFDSVEEVAPEDVQSLLTIKDKNTFDESPVIEAIKDCIAEGTNKKMELVKAAAALTDISQRKALDVLETYTGENPQVHQWNFKVAERGAKVYSMLPPLDNPTEAVSRENDSGSSADF